MIVCVDSERGTINGCTHKALLGGLAMAKLQVGASSEGANTQLLGEIDLGAQTWTNNLKYSTWVGEMLWVVITSNQSHLDWPMTIDIVAIVILIAMSILATAISTMTTAISTLVMAISTLGMVIATLAVATHTIAVATLEKQ